MTRSTRVRMGLWVPLAAAIAVLLMQPAGAWACSCAEKSARQLHREADATFVGIATSTERDGKVARTMFAVTHVWKGDVGATVPVETGLDSDDCPFDFVPGNRYAIFADGDLARGLRTDSCAHPSDLTSISRAGLSTEACTEQSPDNCALRYDPTSALSPPPLAVDGPGVGGPGTPRSGPIAAAGVLLLASAIGTYAAYRSRGAHPGGATS